MQTTVRPANYYISTTKIPDFVETAILELSPEDRLHLAADLLDAMRGEDAVFMAETIEAKWLRNQGYDGLLGVLKWVTMELI